MGQLMLNCEQESGRECVGTDGVDWCPESGQGTSDRMDPHSRSQVVVMRTNDLQATCRLFFVLPRCLLGQ